MLRARCNDCGGESVSVISPNPNKRRGETYLEYRGYKSNKFWAISGSGYRLNIRFGRIGSDGTTIIKAYEHLADAHYDKQERIRKQIAQGYQEID